MTPMTVAEFVDLLGRTVEDGPFAGNEPAVIRTPTGVHQIEAVGWSANGGDRLVIDAVGVGIAGRGAA